MIRPARLGLVGYGSLATQALDALASSLETPLESVVCLARPHGASRARAMLETFGERLAREREVVVSLDDFFARRLTTVAEAAGHEALAEVGVACLAAGCGLIVTSVGALARESLRASLEAASAGHGARLTICPGAIGGIDLLDAAKLSGLEEVTYTSRKPPAAWRGTGAEDLIDLDILEQATVFFSGDAGRAARDFPQNANVAATIALGGLGFERTRVELVADPTIHRNIHEIVVRSRCANFNFRIEGYPLPSNPRTSMTAGYALAASILGEIGKSREVYSILMPASRTTRPVDSDSARRNSPNAAPQEADG